MRRTNSSLFTFSMEKQATHSFLENSQCRTDVLLADCEMSYSRLSRLLGEMLQNQSLLSFPLNEAQELLSKVALEVCDGLRSIFQQKYDQVVHFCLAVIEANKTDIPELGVNALRLLVDQYQVISIEDGEESQKVKALVGLLPSARQAPMIQAVPQFMNKGFGFKEFRHFSLAKFPQLDSTIREKELEGLRADLKKLSDSAGLRQESEDGFNPTQRVEHLSIFRNEASSRWLNSPIVNYPQIPDKAGNQMQIVSISGEGSDSRENPPDMSQAAPPEFQPRPDPPPMQGIPDEDNCNDHIIQSHLGINPADIDSNEGSTNSLGNLENMHRGRE